MGGCIVATFRAYDALGRLSEATRSNHGLLELVPVEAERRVKVTRTYDDAALRVTETTEVGLEWKRSPGIAGTRSAATRGSLRRFANSSVLLADDRDRTERDRNPAVPEDRLHA